MRGIATGGSRGPAGAGVPVGGTSGQVLAKNSNTDYDTAWLDASSLPQNPAVAVTKKTFQQRTVLYDNTLSAIGLFDVSSLPQDYDHLEVFLAGRSTVNGDFWMSISINGDSDQNNYLNHSEYYGTGSGFANSWGRGVGYIAANDSPASQFPATHIIIPEYSKSNRHKSIHYRSHSERLTTQGYTTDGATVWRNTSAINRLAFSPVTGQFAVGSRLQIIGVKEEEVVTDVQNAGTEVAAGWIAADALSYTGADDPSFTVTCVGDQSSKYSAGMKFKLTQATGGTKYFIITAVTVATDTILTLYGGTDYNLENAAISNPYFSIVKAPVGFPQAPSKWMVELIDSSNRNQVTPVQNTWYNPGSLSISIPVGAWHVSYSLAAYITGSSIYHGIKTTLSTANNSESIPELTTSTYFRADGTGYKELYWSHTSNQKSISLTTKTTYYLNAMLTSNSVGDSRVGFHGSTGNRTYVRALCAYL